jgi:hypothetical protein
LLESIPIVKHFATSTEISILIPYHSDAGIRFSVPNLSSLLAVGYLYVTTVFARAVLGDYQSHLRLLRERYGARTLQTPQQPIRDFNPNLNFQTRLRSQRKYPQEYC